MPIPCLSLEQRRAAHGQFDPRTSDIDFLVEFAPALPGGHFDAYFGLLEALQDLFGCKVDLVVASAIRNPYFLESANKTRKLVCAA
jgi:hypothetical protein